jgi:hypothetical protein
MIETLCRVILSDIEQEVILEKDIAVIIDIHFCEAIGGIELVYVPKLNVRIFTRQDAVHSKAPVPKIDRYLHAAGGAADDIVLRIDLSSVTDVLQ